MWPPPYCTLTGSVQPVVGDQDLYLWRSFNPWTWSIVASSLRGRTARDTVAFSNPPLTPCNVTTWIYGVVQIYDYASGIGTFTYRGFT